MWTLKEKQHKYQTKNKRKYLLLSKKWYGFYKSIINSNNNSNSATSIKEYLDKVGQYNSTDFKYRIAQKYYTALGRERYGMYRVTNFLEDVQEDLRKAGY